MNFPASTKYAIIKEMTQRDNNLLNITWLCSAAGVSRSGYYHYLETGDLKQQREEQDQMDFLIILKAYQYRGYDKGARGIYMRLLHMAPPAHMNIKKIRRLMKKYGLFCPIRKANPYRRMAKALRISNVAPNHQTPTNSGQTAVRLPSNSRQTPIKFPSNSGQTAVRLPSNSRHSH